MLRHFKEIDGTLKYDRLLTIPIDSRIPVLAANNFELVSKSITVGLTLAMESMNLKKPMNAIQILDLSEAIIDSASEDNLAIEDVMMFLQKFVRGEYGANYESMDIPKFMIAFEKYRETRWKELNRIRYEAHVQNKTTGDTGRVAQPDQLSEHFASLGDRLSSMKTSIGKLKEENKNLKMDNL